MLMKKSLSRGAKALHRGLRMAVLHKDSYGVSPLCRGFSLLLNTPCQY